MSALRAYSASLRQPAGLQASADQLVEEEILNDVPAAEGCHPHCHTDELLSHMMTLEMIRRHGDVRWFQLTDCLVKFNQEQLHHEEESSRRDKNSDRQVQTKVNRSR